LKIIKIQKEAVFEFEKIIKLPNPPDDDIFTIKILKHFELSVN